MWHLLEKYNLLRGDDMKVDFVTSKKERMSYASYFIGQNIIFGLVGNYLMLFYTDYAVETLEGLDLESILEIDMK